MIDLKALTLEELKGEIVGMGEPAYRAEQVFAWVYKKGAKSFSLMTDLSEPLREKLAGKFSIAGLEVWSEARAKDGTEKFVFRLESGVGIETVLIPSGERATVCVSTQAGCKFRCAFCASGRRGFIRNLSPAEIVGQVLYATERLGRLPTNIVFMGMGEPLDNYENLAKSIAILNSPHGPAIAARRMTVSTAGVVPGIIRFKELGLQVNLSVSLHAATDPKRSSLMPINKQYPLEKLLRACEDYIGSGGRKITLEVVLLRDVNDAPEDVDGLARIAKRLRAKINFIPFSPVAGLPFETPEPARIQSAIQRFRRKNVPVTLRQSKGREIAAACGQLAGRLG
jgi:23S rRNA (adenine2503-C2)-methyltransferase